MAAPPIRIALVEDNPVDVFFFQVALEDAGVTCDLAAFDSTAMFFATLPEAPPFDLIVTEWFLRSADAQRLFTEIRNFPAHSNTPIAIASAFWDAPTEAVAREAFHYFTKSIDAQQIIAVLTKLENRRHGTP